MSYVKQTWIDGLSPINAERLNHMEEGISDSHSSGNGANFFEKSVSVAASQGDVLENYVITDTGEAVYTETWNCTRLIALPFDPGTEITVKCTFFGIGGLAFYDSTGKVIECINGNNASNYGISSMKRMQVVTLVMPSGAVSIRLSAFTGTDGTYSDPSNFAISGTVSTNIVEAITDIDSRTEVLATKTESVTVTFTAEDIVSGVVSSDTGMEGDLIESDAWVSTKLIAFAPDNRFYVTMRCTIYGTAGAAFYNDSGICIGVVSSNNAAEYGFTPSLYMQEISVIPPSGTAFVRMCAYKNNGSYTKPSDFALSGKVSTNIGTQMRDMQKYIDAKFTDFREKKVLVLGDSISTDYYGNYKKWVTHLCNDGFLSVANTVNDSIHATGFVARYNNGENDFLTRIEAIADKDTFDLVVIFGGINDFIQNIPMGESGGDKATYFKPAVDYFFDYLVNNFTQARIAVLSPLRTNNTNANTAGNKQNVYTDYIKTVAKSYCLPVLNLTEESGFCPFIPTFRDRWTLTEYVGGDGVTGDGVHPNEEYERKYLAPMIRGFLQGLM